MILSLFHKTPTGSALSPRDVGPIHFVGIGGIGMSGIADILHALGYTVQGSDAAENANVKRLREKGIAVTVGHAAANLGQASVVVMSSAVKRDNPEVIAARAAMIPVVRRAEMLGELMRLKRAVGVGGTHGKTTTTSMVATLFDEAGLDPTVINGGIINAYGTNARLGTGEWMVVETDESDGSFLKLPATITIVTNMDPEHLDHYGDFAAVRRAYTTFVENIPFYGFAVLCADHPEVLALAQKVEDRRVITYGLDANADVTAQNLVTDNKGARFDVCFLCRKSKESKTVKGFCLPVIGRHNVQNALAALTVGWQLGFSDEVLRRGLARFEGVKRRFTRTGEVGDVTIIDDYAHHPNEIRATLKAALQARGSGRTIAVVQPHRFTRLRDLMDDFAACFTDANTVIVADVYAASETPIEGINRDALIKALKDNGHKDVHPLDGQEALAPLVAKLAQPGDYVICLGAGSISRWANDLPGELKALEKSS